MSKDMTTQMRKSAPVFITVDNQSIGILVLLEKNAISFNLNHVSSIFNQ